MSKNIKNLTELKNSEKLEKFQAEQREVKKTLTKNVEQAQELRRRLLLNSQARQLLTTRRDELEKAIALLDGRTTRVEFGKVSDYHLNERIPKFRRPTARYRKNLAKHLHHKLSAGEVREFITQLTEGLERRSHDVP